MKRVFLLPLLLCTIEPVFAADTWRFETGIYGTSLSSDSYDMVDAGMGGRFYFAPLPMESDYPLAEAVYMERAGYIEAGYSRLKSDVNSVILASPVTMKGGDNSYSFGAAFLHPSADYMLSIGGTRSNGTADTVVSTIFGDFHTHNKSSTDSFGGSAGYFLMKNLLATVSYDMSNTDTTFTPVGFPSSLPAQTSVRSRFSAVCVRYWQGLGDYFVVIEPSLGYSSYEPSNSQKQRSTSLGANARFYWTKFQDVWIAYGMGNDKDGSNDSRSYSAGYDLFLTRSISLGLSLSRTNISNCSGCDYRGWNASLGMRF